MKSILRLLILLAVLQGACTAVAQYSSTVPINNARLTGSTTITGSVTAPGYTAQTGTNTAYLSGTGLTINGVPVGGSGTATALAGQVILQKANGQQIIYTGSINAAYGVSGSADTVIVGSGTYNNDTVALSNSNAHNFRFEPGAVWINSGSGAAMYDSGSDGIVTVAGAGTFNLTGTTSNESFFDITGSGTQLYFSAYQVLGTGTAATTGTSLSIIKSENGGYVNGWAKDYIGTNETVCELAGDGKGVLHFGDQLTSTGSGVSTVVIGNGYVDPAGTQEIFNWFVGPRFISDPNSYVMNVTGTNPQVRVVYVDVGRIAGCFRDPSTDAGTFVAYVNWKFWDPRYFHNGASGNTATTVCTLDGANSFYDFNGDDIQNGGAPLLECSGGNAGGGSLFHSGRAIEGSGTGGSVDAIVINNGTLFLSVDHLTNQSEGNDLTYNNGTLNLYGGKFDDNINVNNGGLDFWSGDCAGIVGTDASNVNFGPGASVEGVPQIVEWPGQIIGGQPLADSQGYLYYAFPTHANNVLADPAGQLYWGGMGNGAAANNTLLTDTNGNIIDASGSPVIDLNGNWLGNTVPASTSLTGGTSTLIVTSTSVNFNSTRFGPLIVLSGTLSGGTSSITNSAIYLHHPWVQLTSVGVTTTSPAVSVSGSTATTSCGITGTDTYNLFIGSN